MDNKCSLKIFFELLLQPFNIPQSAVVPPNIFDAVYNVSAGWVLGKIAELFPFDNSLVDIAEPFLGVERLIVKKGEVDIPVDFRNFLDCGAYVKEDRKSVCSESMTPALALRAYNQNLVQNGCVRQSITVVDIAQFDLLTKSQFDKPTLEQPIACFFGKKKMKICPTNIEVIDFRYLKNENLVRYGYTMQPDDTFIFNATTSIESQWTNAAFPIMYKAASKLLGVYLRDNNVSNFSYSLSDVEFKV